MHAAHLLLALTVGSNPLNTLTTDRVDMVEINHLYDEQGRLLFDQIIYYDWHPKQKRYNVRAWRLIKSPSQVPYRRRNGGYLAIWHDGGVLRRVRAQVLRESWTQFDPELLERAYLPKEKRRDLSKQLNPAALRR